MDLFSELKKGGREISSQNNLRYQVFLIHLPGAIEYVTTHDPSRAQENNFK